MRAPRFSHHLADGRKFARTDGGVRAIVSINHEAAQPGTVPVAALVARAGGYTRMSRHRHWLRTGHVEEVYRRL